MSGFSRSLRSHRNPTYSSAFVTASGRTPATLKKRAPNKFGTRFLWDGRCGRPVPLEGHCGLRF